MKHLPTITFLLPTDPWLDKYSTESKDGGNINAGTKAMLLF